MDELLELLRALLEDDELEESYDYDDECDCDDDEEECDGDCDCCDLFDECYDDDFDEEDLDDDEEELDEEECDCDCENCELAPECFKEFCDSHENCFDCELFDTCFKETFGHKYTIADEIKEVKFNGPATIVFWMDGTKTVSVCHELDVYDKEKGLSMCLLKKVLGDSSYNEVFRQFIIDEEFEEDEFDEELDEALNTVEELLQTKKLTNKQKDAIKLLLDME